MAAAEKDSLRGAVNSLRQVSSATACADLVQASAAETAEFLGMSPVKFFRQCWALRGKLTHGANPYPDQEDVRNVLSPLEQLVAAAVAWRAANSPAP